MNLTGPPSRPRPSPADSFPESGPAMDEWVRNVYAGLLPALRRADDGVGVARAHSILTSHGFTERETVRGVARLVGANYLDRDGDTLSLGPNAD